MNKRQRRVCGRWLALACLAGSVGRLGVAGLTAQWSPDPDWRGGRGSVSGTSHLDTMRCGAVRCGALQYATVQHDGCEAVRMKRRDRRGGDAGRWQSVSAYKWRSLGLAWPGLLLFRITMRRTCIRTYGAEVRAPSVAWPGLARGARQTQAYRSAAQRSVDRQTEEEPQYLGSRYDDETCDSGGSTRAIRCVKVVQG
jgi:hypothetical protein